MCQSVDSCTWVHCSLRPKEGVRSLREVKGSCVRSSVAAGNLTQVLWKSRTFSYPLSHPPHKAVENVYYTVCVRAVFTIHASNFFSQSVPGLGPPDFWTWLTFHVVTLKTLKKLNFIYFFISIYVLKIYFHMCIHVCTCVCKYMWIRMGDTLGLSRGWLDLNSCPHDV